MRSPGGCHWTWGNENSRINMERAAPGLTATSSGQEAVAATQPAHLSSPHSAAFLLFNSLMPLTIAYWSSGYSWEDSAFPSLPTFKLNWGRQGQKAWNVGHRGRALEVEGRERPELTNAACEKKTLDIPREGRAWTRLGDQNSQGLEDFAKLELNPLKASLLLGTSRYCLQVAKSDGGRLRRIQKPAKGIWTGRSSLSPSLMKTTLQNWWDWLEDGKICVCVWGGGISVCF